MASTSPDPEGSPADLGGATIPPDTLESFAADLRALRLHAGSATLISLQHATSISKTVISEAFRGKRLPSTRTIDRLVRAMDADPAEWISRRDRLARLDPVAAGGLPPVEAAQGNTPVVTRARPSAVLRRRTAVLIAAATFAFGLAVSGGVGYAVASTAVQQAHDDAVAQTRKDILDAPVSPRAQINVTNGVDPALTPCVNDAKVVAAENRTDDTKLEIIWSNKCYAGWGRVTRYDGKAAGNEVSIAIYPETAPNGPDRQSATEPGVQGAYTTLVVRPSPQTRLCAVGSITLDGKSIDLGSPICI